LLLGVTAPVAVAAATLPDEPWTLPLTELPDMAFPRFEGETPAKKAGASRATVPADEGRAQAGAPDAPSGSSPAAAEEAAPTAAAPSVDAPRQRAVPTEVPTEVPTQGGGAGSAPAPPDAAEDPADRVAIVETTYGAPPSGDDDEDPLAEVPIVDSGTGPIAPLTGAELGEDPLPVVPERRVAQVVRQSSGLDDVGLAAQGPREVPRHLGHLEAVGQPVAHEVVGLRPDHLGLGRQPAGGRGVHHPGAVALERRPLRGGHPLGRLGDVALAVGGGVQVHRG